MRTLLSAISFHFHLNYDEVASVVSCSSSQDLAKNLASSFHLDESKVRDFLRELESLNFMVQTEGRTVSAKNLVSEIQHGTTITIQSLDQGHALRIFVEKYYQLRVLPVYRYRDGLEMTFNLLKN